MTVPVLGELVTDPISVMLETGLSQFHCSLGLDGLAKVDNGCLEIVVIHSDAPGKGQFRLFIECCKLHYREILIIEVMNPWLEGVLLRYGFKHTKVQQPWGEINSGMIWKA